MSKTLEFNVRLADLHEPMTGIDIDAQRRYIADKLRLIANQVETHGQGEGGTDGASWGFSDSTENGDEVLPWT